MKLRNLFLGTLFLTIGLASCSKDNEPSKQTQGDTYVGVSLKFASGSSTRSLPEDYNSKGEWKGRDEIKDVTVFLVNTAKGTIDFNSFGVGSFQSITSDGVLNPTLALKATSGDNVDVYVVVNGNKDILATLKATPVGEFATVFAAEQAKVVADVAKYDNGKDVVMMTNAKSVSINVQPNITSEDAKNGTNNRADVNVERVAARAFVTIDKEVTAKTIKARINGVEKEVGSVTDVKYAVGQVNKAFYLMKKSDFKTPLYDLAINKNWADNKLKFDYSGLDSFTNVTEIDDDKSSNLTQLSEELTKETTSKFVLPLTHDQYQKGNTTYVEIQATFKPNANIWGDTKVISAPEAGKTIWLGANGKFYSSEENAKNPEAGGVKDQKVGEFRNGIMKYVVWLNPDDITTPVQSPVVRNQVYHIHISGFNEIGLNNNPINPNPQPEPGPDPNPINPDDPLSTPKTYLSVSVKVLNWGIHSYKIKLGNDNY